MTLRWLERVFHVAASLLIVDALGSKITHWQSLPKFTRTPRLLKSKTPYAIESTRPFVDDGAAQFSHFP
jgi:hypothetical protein